MAQAMKYIEDANETITIDAGHYILEERTYEANDTITAGQWVALDIPAATASLCNKVVLADSDAATARACVGVAIEGGVAGDLIRVMKRGLFVNASVVTGATKGSLLYVFTTAGIADDAVPASFAVAVPCGVALEDAAANVANVWVMAPF